MTTGSNGIALESHVLGDCTRKRRVSLVFWRVISSLDLVNNGRYFSGHGGAPYKGQDLKMPLFSYVQSENYCVIPFTQRKCTGNKAPETRKERDGNPTPFDSTSV